MSNSCPIHFLPPSLANQASNLLHHIQTRFEQKQNQSPQVTDVREFRLGIVIKKTVRSNESGRLPYIRIDLGLIGPSAFVDRDNYAKAAALLRQAKREVMRREAVAENIGVFGPPMYRRQPLSVHGSCPKPASVQAASR